MIDAKICAYARFVLNATKTTKKNGTQPRKIPRYDVWHRLVIGRAGTPVQAPQGSFTLRSYQTTATLVISTKPPRPR